MVLALFISKCDHLKWKLELVYLQMCLYKYRWEPIQLCNLKETALSEQGAPSQKCWCLYSVEEH